MRSSILVFVLLAVCGTAAADGGGYYIQTIGWGSYRGGLERFSPGEARLQVGGGVVRDQWAVEASLSIYIPDQPYNYCASRKCGGMSASPVDLVLLNLDVRRAWRILRPRQTGSRFSRAIRKTGLDVVLHGGPRWTMSETPRDAYQGPGVGGGVTLELNLKAVSLFMDLGMDVAALRGAHTGDVMTARLPYFAWGMRLGWF